MTYRLVCCALLALGLGFAVPKNSFAQKHCKCDSKEILDRKTRDKGLNTLVIGNDMQHPITTFRRQSGTWYSSKNSQAENLENLRTLLKDAWLAEADTSDPKMFFAIYDDIFTSAQNTTNLYYNPKDSPSTFTGTHTIKNAAFVLLAGFDRKGNALNHTSHPTLESDLKSKVITYIKRLEWDKDNPRNDDCYYSGNGRSYSSNHYWIEKNLVMLLQAYDYMKAVYPNDPELETCAALLHCYARHVYKSGTGIAGGFGRKNNHSLQAAGAMGLASIVLGDQGASNYRNSWHPDRWSSTSIWATMQNLYEEETKRGGVNGFAEGPHYFRHSMETLLPYFLAYTNARPEIKSGEMYGAKGVVFNFSTKELNASLWHDPDLPHLMEWYAHMVLPNRTLVVTDGSHANQIFDGALSYRTDEFRTLDYLPQYQGVFNQVFQVKWVDMTCDIAAAIAESDLYGGPLDHEEGVVLESGDILLRPNLRPSDPSTYPFKSLFFHLNAETQPNGTRYLGGNDHEDYDALSFTIAGPGGYQAIDPGIYKDKATETEKRYADAHSTITFDHSNKKKTGPVDGTNIIEQPDFETPDKEVSVIGYHKKGSTLQPFRRSVKYFPSQEGGLMFRITDDFYDPKFLDDQVWTFRLNGPGLQSNSTLTYNSGERTVFWDGDCSNNSKNSKMTSIHRVGRADPSKVSDTLVVRDHENGQHTQFQLSVDKPNALLFRSWIYINGCDYALDTMIPLKPEQGVVVRTGTQYTYNIVQDDVNYYTTDSLFGFRNDTLRTDARDLVLSYDFEPAGDCSRGTAFRRIWMRDATSFEMNTDTFVISNDTIARLAYRCDKKYYYSGYVHTTDAFDTVVFWLPEVPNAALTKMVEGTSLNYSYDTLSQKITLYLADSGMHEFKFRPADQCVTACFFPPDSIYNHFPFYGQQTQRLGHELDIVSDTGWLDMRGGAKMVICNNAVCNNLDSLTLQSCVGYNTGGHSGYLSEYRTTEGARYRDHYYLGSGGGEDNLQGLKRTMIIVEDQGALVLRKHSETHIMNGSTILVKPGGTLKIEDSAHVVIGDADSCYGFAEIIVMDSAFLCISPLAEIEFGHDGFDTIDRNIFYISMNPENPAHPSVNRSSNADTLGDCLNFCEIVDSFPAFGIGGHTYGWLNVGKTRAWMQMDSVFCGTDIWVDGLYTLNETRYRFEVCKWDNDNQSCIGTGDTIPMNDTDNYFAGRLQGRINLAEHYNFQRGYHYRIKYKIKQDCGLTDHLTKVIYIPEPTVAQIDGDTLVCGGVGTIKVHGKNSTGSIDSLQWAIWEYVPIPGFDSASYRDNADTFISTIDTLWYDSVTVDTILYDTLWFHTTDTILNDSFHIAQYYQNFFDTVIVASVADTFEFSNLSFENGKKYIVTLNLFNPCGHSKDSLIIRTRPGPDVDAGPDQHVAANVSGVWIPKPHLAASVTGHTGTPVWTPTIGLTPSTSLSAKAAPVNTTTYVLSADDIHGCTSTDAVTVFVNTAANAGRDTLICWDDSVQIGTPAVGTYIYAWSPASLVSNANIAQPYAYTSYGGAHLTLKITDQNGDFLEYDHVTITRDTIDKPAFAIEPGQTFYYAQFQVQYAPVTATTLTWDFDDGNGSQTGKTAIFEYQYPSVPSAQYDVCVSHTNACGLQELCKLCEFNHIGQVIPNGNPTGLEDIAPKATPTFTLTPNPSNGFVSVTYTASDEPTPSTRGAQERSTHALNHSTSEECSTPQENGVMKNTAPITITIHDLTGRILHTQTLTNNKTTLNLTSLAKGPYIYRISNKNTTLAHGELIIAR